MATTTRSPGFWQSARELPARMPLRIKLITAVLALVAMALVGISVVGITILRNTLLSPYDSTLTTNNINAAANGPVPDFLSGGSQHDVPGLGLYWISAGHVYTVWRPIAEVSSYSAVVPSGQLHVQTTARLPRPAFQTNASWLAANSGKIISLPAVSGRGHWHVLMKPQPFATASGGTVRGTIVLAVDVTSVYQTTNQLASIDLLVSLAAIGLLGIVGIAVIRSSLRPLVEIEKTAGAIAAGDLTRRVPELDPRTEVGKLGRSLNVMLSHIETAFRARTRSEHAARRSEERLRQFVADASHELRTPLTAIRGFAEYYRQRGGVESPAGPTGADPTGADPTGADPTGAGPPAAVMAGALASPENANGHLTPADLDRIMHRVEQEAARMGVLVEDMLLLARLDQQRPLEHKSVDLLALAADAVHDARVVAPGRDINLAVASGAALLVNGDEVRLRQVVGNLMSNALAHTPDASAVDVVVRSGSLDEGGGPHPQPPDAEFVFAPDLGQPPAGDEPASTRAAAVVEVTDHGPGLTPDQAQHVFERFYRVDQARTSGGTGLGLAIVTALVKAHGGAVWVRSRPGHGATFCIALPLAPEAVDADEADHVTVAGPPPQQPAQPTDS
jgi:two-component system, OmpR family, sensor kinase